MECLRRVIVFQKENTMKRIITVQDISCVGKCSLTVALPVISAMGVEAAILPTAVLSTHTAFKGFTFRDLTEDITPICDHWKKEKISFDAIYTGYLGSFEQLDLMKKMFAALAAAVMCVSAFAFDVTEYLPLKGTVKNYTRTDYGITSKFGEYFRTPEMKSVRVFDRAGREIESSEMTGRGTLVNKIKNTYDASGKLTAQDGYNADNALIWKSTVTYGAAGNKTDESEYGKDGGLKNKTIYTYTGSLLTDESYYGAGGELVWKIVYAYDDAGAFRNGRHLRPSGRFGAGELGFRRECGKCTGGITGSARICRTIFGSGTRFPCAGISAQRRIEDTN